MPVKDASKLQKSKIQENESKISKETEKNYDGVTINSETFSCKERIKVKRNSGKRDDHKDYIKNNIERIKNNKKETSIASIDINEFDIDIYDKNQNKSFIKTQQFDKNSRKIKNSRSLTVIKTTESNKNSSNMFRNELISKKSSKYIKKKSESLDLNQILLEINQKTCLDDNNAFKKKTFLNVVKDNLIKNVIEKTCLQRKLPIEEEKKKNLTISTSLRSQQVLAMKFIKEFNEIVTELGIIKDEIDINSTMLILHI